VFISIQEGAYYEAHQQLRVLAQRYLKAENYEAAIDILFSGAQALLQAGQGGSGVDLCILMVEAYVHGEVACDAESKGGFFATPGTQEWHALAIQPGKESDMVAVLSILHRRKWVFWTMYGI